MLTLIFYHSDMLKYNDYFMKKGLRQIATPCEIFNPHPCFPPFRASDMDGGVYCQINYYFRRVS